VIVGTSAATTVNTGTGTDQVYVGGTRPGAALTINGQSGADRVAVGNQGNMQSVLGMLTVTNAGSYSTLTLDDTADPSHLAVTMDVGGTYGTISGLAPAVIRYAKGDVRSLTVSGGGGGDDFTINNTALTLNSLLNGGTRTTVNTGGGPHTVQVNATTGPLFINVDGTFDTIGVGSATAGLDSLNGSIVLSGSTTLSNLYVDDGAST